ncbi:MAG: pilus assembly protein PilZ [Spirochaetaceae bacterium]|nr:pilus assembly protein PilZ [Spirochaetaceae bacterium]
MGILTSQKITEYYERYKSIDVTFTKEIIQVTGMITQQVYLKCIGDFWPCVVFSSSFQGAKVVANVKSGIVEKLRQANNSASLRLSFKNADSNSPVTFFVAARSVGYAPYGDSKEMAIFTLQFTQRPPDDLIEIMGRLLDANVNSTKRRDERVLLTADSIRKLRLLSKETATFIQGVPRRCILRDISFSGAKFIMMGVAKFLVEKEAALRIDFDDPRESYLIRGKFIRADLVEGRKELLALVLLFNEATVPMGYKVRLNDFLCQIRVDNRGGDSHPETRRQPENAAAAPPPAAKPHPGPADKDHPPEEPPKAKVPEKLASGAT